VRYLNTSFAYHFLNQTQNTDPYNLPEGLLGLTAGEKAYKLISLTSNCPDSLFKRAGQQVHFRYKKPYREMPIEEIVTRRRIFSEYKYISVEDIIDELANE